MTSGNFLIGESLFLPAFSKWVLPVFEGVGYSVIDRVEVKPNYREVGVGGSSLLVSIAGEGDLEKVVNELLIRTGDTIETSEELRKQGMHREVLDINVRGFSHHEEKNGEEVAVYRGKYKVIGIYKEFNTASQLFPTIAQKYLLQGVREEVEKISGKLKSLGKSLS